MFKKLLPPAMLAVTLLSKLTLTAPADTTDLISRQQAGCSANGECCIIMLNTAGCGQAGLQQVGVDIGSGCRNLIIGMYAAWVTECTGYFDGCYLYGDTDCQDGRAAYLSNVRDQCINPGFTIKSVRCFGV